MDIMLLTSISEGQPLTILEGFAAKKPSIATNVGNCYGLIYGENDPFGAAGIVVPVMNISEITNAILKLVSNPKLIKQMGRTDIIVLCISIGMCIWKKIIVEFIEP